MCVSIIVCDSSDRKLHIYMIVQIWNKKFIFQMCFWPFTENFMLFWKIVCTSIVYGDTYACYGDKIIHQT